MYRCYCLWAAAFFLNFSEASFAIGASFRAPDSGRHKTPYTCSFHWFRTKDFKVVGMDIIRSEDTGNLGLRVFVFDTNGTPQSLIYEAPAKDWAEFSTSEKPNLNGSDPVLGRGLNWVAGAVQVKNQSINSVKFNFSVIPLTLGKGTGRLGLHFVKMNATDFPRVRTKGTLEIDGVKYDINSVGPVSIHYGDSLPDYGYVATVPNLAFSDELPELLLGSVEGDDLRVGETLVGSRAFTYAYGSRGVRQVSFHLGDFWQDGEISLGKHTSLILSDVKPVKHELLGVPTTTASARAKLKTRSSWPWGREKIVDLGRVYLDLRGASYLSGFSR